MQGAFYFKPNAAYLPHTPASKHIEGCVPHLPSKLGGAGKFGIPSARGRGALCVPPNPPWFVPISLNLGRTYIESGFDSQVFALYNSHIAKNATSVLSKLKVLRGDFLCIQSAKQSPDPCLTDKFYFRTSPKQLTRT